MLADNVVAVYLNGHKLGQQAMVDCNDGAFGPCHWTAGGTLTVSDNTAADFNNPGLNYITFLVNNKPDRLSRSGPAERQRQSTAVRLPFQIAPSSPARTASVAGPERAVVAVNHCLLTELVAVEVHGNHVVCQHV